MGFGALRALALELNQFAHGVEATVTRPAPNNAPIDTRVIWVTPITDGYGIDNIQRSESVLVMALSRADVPTVPKGTVIVAPPKDGDADRTWIVEATQRVDPDKVHVVVIEQP